MPTYDIPADVYNMVDPIARAHGVPTWLWGSIAKAESTYNPKDVGDNGSSYGLFQLHIGAGGNDTGQGQAYAGNPTALFDPALNAQIAMPAIGAAYRDGVSLGLNGVELARFTAANSGHPNYMGDVTGELPVRIGGYAAEYLGVTGGDYVAVDKAHDLNGNQITPGKKRDLEGNTIQPGGIQMPLKELGSKAPAPKPAAKPSFSLWGVIRQGLDGPTWGWIGLMVLLMVLGIIVFALGGFGVANSD